MSAEGRVVARRDFLASSGALLGASALRGARAPAPRAQRVLFLFCPGGVSHVDAFDPKPELRRQHGKKARGKVLHASPWRFRPNPRCGTEISDLFPHVRSVADRFLLLRSMFTSHGDHFAAALQMHTGSGSFTRPSIGSWVSYALGLQNRSLPGHVVIAPHLPYAGAQLWDSAFLPAEHQGLWMRPSADPVPNLHARDGSAEMLASLELELLRTRNRAHVALHPDPSGRRLAWDKNFETAARMQRSMPRVLDVDSESDETLALYGMRRGQRSGYAWQCLVARRMLEQDVRFVSVLDVGASRNWDTHSRLTQQNGLARRIDQPIAALLVDLERRGLLDDTLVVWTTEFGRSPFATGSGRGHWPKAFSTVLAGAGVRQGETFGASDELGMDASVDRVHVHDLHATILHALGFDHRRLTYRHAGRDFRLTDVAGNVVRGVFA